MKKNIIQPGQVMLEAWHEDTKFRSQIKEVYRQLFNNAYTMKEVSVITGIDRANICRYIRILRKNNLIAIVKKDYCSVTRYKANRYTTNPEFIPVSLQLKLF